MVAYFVIADKLQKLFHGTSNRKVNHFMALLSDNIFAGSSELHYITQ